MSNIYYFDSYIPDEPKVACIGLFDGVHKGHQELIKETIKVANKKGIKPYLITFKPDPIKLIDGNIKEIYTFNQRIKYINKFGIKDIIVINFDKTMMNNTYKDFNLNVLKKLNLSSLICGYDFTYGYNAKGNYNTLKGLGFDVIKVNEVSYYGKKVSSSRIRKELIKGNLKLVEKLLNHEYK